MRYFSASEYYKQVFGCKAYKIAIDAGCTCPNRDGTKGTGGCIFCGESGSGDFAAPRALGIGEQIERAKALVRAKSKGGVFIAYFQNFTNTYGNTARLCAKYEQALASPQVAGLALATRPDCLADDMLQNLAHLAQSRYVSVELGLQTSSDETARAIRRAYPTAVYDDAVRRLHNASAKIHVVTHVIFGLPGESKAQMLQSVRHCVASGTDGIKIALLHVLEGTELAEQWRAGKVRCLDMEEYLEIVGNALKLLPPNVVVHRLTGDGAKRLLLAPLWSADKKRVHNALRAYVAGL